MVCNNKEYDNKLLLKNIPYIRLGNYTTALNPIEHKCTKCNTIVIKPPKKVLAGVGCKVCSVRKSTCTQEDYDKSIENTTYKRVGEYINSLTDIEHMCVLCGSVHLVRPASVLRGHSCKFCSNRVARSTEQYFEDIKDRPFICTEEYVNNKIPLKHLCNVCNTEWYAIPNNVVSKESGCPTCAKSIQVSKGEKELLEFIKSLYSGWVIENDRDILGGRELDIVLPDLGIAIEYNGVYWHSDQYVENDHQLNKTLKTAEIGFRLIHINEDEWKNKTLIVKSRLKSIFGLSKKIYARNCTISTVDSTEATKFLEGNHIQGSCPSSIRYGLYLENKLVALMTFGIPRFSTKYDYELIRFCSILDTTVVGGASKLFHHFRKHHTGSTLSYSDKRWSEGNLYKKLGFTYSHTSSPNYRYYKGLNSLSRNQCQKHLLVKEGYDINMTEKEIMKSRGYYAVYDCGNDIWEYTHDNHRTN